MENSGAIYTLAGSIFAAAIAGIIAIYTHRNNLAQNRLENILRVAFDAASLDHAAAVDSFKGKADGQLWTVRPITEYLVFHIVFTHHLMGGGGVLNIDDKIIKKAFNNARDLSRLVPVNKSS